MIFLFGTVKSDLLKQGTVSLVVAFLITHFTLVFVYLPWFPAIVLVNSRRQAVM
jgi:hypothetical protein